MQIDQIVCCAGGLQMLGQPRLVGQHGALFFVVGAAGVEGFQGVELFADRFTHLIQDVDPAVRNHRRDDQAVDDIANFEVRRDGQTLRGAVVVFQRGSRQAFHRGDQGRDVVAASRFEGGMEGVVVTALAEAGQLQLNLQATDVAAIIESTVAGFSIVADMQGVRLNIDAINLPRVNADGDLLAQVLRNLISNALRHTPNGGTVSVQCATDNLQTVTVNVIDTGEGIATEDLPHVFDRFYRGYDASSQGKHVYNLDYLTPREDAPKSRARTSGGTGLGLAIARTQIEAMGGQIGVMSEPGRGAKFWFTLRTE